MIRHSDILNASRSVGFDLCGVARPRSMHTNAQHLQQWIEQGDCGGLDYMCRNADKRSDATLLVEGTQSVVVCGVSYKSDINTHYTPGQRCKIASYACNRDYHKSIKKMLLQMFSLLKESYPSLEGRAFTDSAPLFEKQYAVDAGLGWIGRQSLLITPQFGSYVLLGELLLNEACDSYDTPLDVVGCGECHRCIEACPNRAINGNLTIDARRCISCLTIEQAHDGQTPLHGWIFGCDECQMCCPYNLRATHHTNPSFDPLFNPNDISADEWLTMSEEHFADHFGSTPLRRSGLQRIQDNINK